MNPAVPARIQRIVIVGGGSAGWMTAAALATGLRGKGIDIELVESEQVATVGVGEATFPSILNYNRMVGIDETEFLRATDGTFKLGIFFHDWRVKGEHYFHSFGDLGQLAGPHALWGQHRRLGLAGNLDHQSLPAVMAREGRFVVAEPPKPPYDYAYQFDAALYAAFLRRLAMQRGVRHTLGHIVDVQRRPDGGVAGLLLADGRQLTGDLFIDCSGFRSLLLGQTLAEPFLDYSHWLPVDAAWACPTERVGEALPPYTRATALEGGWAWRIPLRSRTGNGHVFSSRFIDVEKAREQLLQQLDGAPLAEPRLLRFTTGQRQRFWVGNVLAIGLSSGFLEPLESTSIYLIQCGISRLMVQLTEGGPLDDEAVARFNEGAATQFRRIRDFIILHYCTTARRDSALWRHVASMELPDTLAFKMEAWRRFGVVHQYDEEAFGTTSWLSVYSGMGCWPECADPVLDELPRQEAAQALEGRAQAIRRAVEPLPAHHRYLADRLR
ncbi:tryptophan 7-halogenase [Pelomonas sp. P7]|uniref:Tryptophan 7-halogenase n=1 Tax=Pelomonas caseinilytica TaxID=2906763 RepID=A0ABS8XCK7_9BURK|nr:tryptophan halogenase family protein [Pelomonas sp. P7]MCE4536950.1 tryptophan 7-halogenase [Pelomonas sp. P7]